MSAYQERRLYQQIVADTPDHVSIVDRDYTYRVVNPAYLIAHGRPREAIVGKKVPELLGPKTFDEVVKPRLDRCLAGETIRYQAWFDFAARGRTFMAVTYYPYHDQAGRIVGVVVSARDVTELKQAEEAQAHLQRQLGRHAEELEQRVAERTAQLAERVAEVERLNRAMKTVLESLEVANDQLATFAQGVSHDLRTSLHAIAQLAQPLLAAPEQALDGQGRERMERIVAAIGRADHLISNLLSYAQVGQGSLHPEPIALDEVVEDVVEQLRGTIEGSGAALEIARPLPTILGHRGLLVQILLNLLSNALTHVVPGQRPHIRIFAEARQPVRLWVADSGPGIAVTDRQRIFEPFVRLNGCQQHGGGIGLAIVRRAAERLGGAVGVESALGRGSRFWVELAAAP